MSFTLVEVAGANFRTDEASDELNTEFMKHLGVRVRYMPARLAIARSLAFSTPPEVVPTEFDPGKSIKGDTLFGTGASLSTWLALIIERSERDDITLKDLHALVGAHWRRGIGLLRTEWDQSDKDLARFVRRLVDEADLPTTGLSTTGEPIVGGEIFSDGLVSLLIGEKGEDAATGEQLSWEMNGPGGSPHCAIMGGVGSGKTRTAVAMLHSIRSRANVPLIAFDFKGDLGTDSEGQGYHIDQLFGAQTVEPPRQAIPLNVLTLDSRDEITVAEAASRFRESFGRLKGARLGDRQRDAVHEAASRALRRHDPCQIHHIRDELISVYDEREMNPDGAISTMNEICRFPLFQPAIGRGEFFQRSWIVKLPPNVVEDSRNIVVNLILDALDQHLNSLPDATVSNEGVRGLRVICLVDEAHRILSTRLPALSNLVRMSRSKGGAIMLVSQSPDDFIGEDDDFLSEMGLVVAFSTNAPPKAATRILGRGANLATLKTGQCYAKRRGDQLARKILAWEPRVR